MADETIVTPEAEKIAPQPEAPAEGSMASIEAPAPEAKKEETVPLSVYLALKDDVKELKQELKARPQSKAEEKATIKAFTEKYPDTDPDAISAIIQMAVSEVEAKYTPIIERQESEKKQEAFDKQFDIIFDKALALNPDSKDVDKEVIKALALTAQYNNTPVADLIKKVYPTSTVGKATTENDMRATGDAVERIVDIDSITPEQRSQIIADPKLRQEYFDKLDALGR